MIHDPIPEQVLEALPVFPLPGIVLFPGTLLPLHIFEPRYRAMLADCMAGARCLAMAFQLEREQEGRPTPRWAPVAGLGRIVHHEPLPDGRSNIVLQGLARVRLDELPFVPPYRRARARVVGDASASVPAVDYAALRATAVALASSASVGDIDLTASDDPGAAADLCAHRLLTDAFARQTILEEFDARERVRVVTGHAAELLARLRRSPSGTGSA